MLKHYVYLHREADTGKPFYVGKGTLRRSLATYERAHSTSARNVWWHRKVAKHGLTVQILEHFATDAEAQDFEREIIAKIGRRRLVNLTDGGDGSAGLVASDALRAKRSANAMAPRSAAWIASIREARKNGGNGGGVKRGDRLPPEWRKAIARAKVGERNPMFGRIGEAAPNRRAVVNDATGETWPTVTAAAQALGFRLSTLHNYLTGHRPNPTALRFAA